MQLYFVEARHLQKESQYAQKALFIAIILSHNPHEKMKTYVD